MRDSVTLIEAIEANSNGLKSLEAAACEIQRKRGRLTDQLVALEAEIKARSEMADAMQRVQDLLPKDETIKFLIPRDLQ